jgi:hypothetical protein
VVRAAGPKNLNRIVAQSSHKPPFVLTAVKLATLSLGLEHAPSSATMLGRYDFG